jgi:hypothetical protein
MIEPRIASTIHAEDGILAEEGKNRAPDDSLNACLSDIFDPVMTHPSFACKKW